MRFPGARSFSRNSQAVEERPWLTRFCFSFSLNPCTSPFCTTCGKATLSHSTQNRGNWNAWSELQQVFFFFFKAQQLCVNTESERDGERERPQHSHFNAWNGLLLDVGKERLNSVAFAHAFSPYCSARKTHIVYDFHLNNGGAAAFFGSHYVIS